MSARLTPLLCIALGALALGACECIKTVPQCPDGVKCITYDQYCGQSLQAQWQMMQVCGLVDPGAEYRLDFAQRDSSCTAVLAEKIDAGLVLFEAVAAAECLTQERTTCDPRCRWRGPPVLPELAPTEANCSDPCDRVFRGTRTSGETCELSVECLEGLYCDLEHGCPGRCATQLRIGDPTPRVEACRTGFTIALIDGGLRCDDVVDAGGLCGRADDELGFHRCAAGDACLEQPLDLADAGDAGLASDGGDDGGVTDAGAFDAGTRPLICLSWPDAGAAPDVDCSRAGCPFGQICAGLRCVPIAKRGQACAPGVIFCAEGLDCFHDGGALQCAPTPSAGSVCQSDSRCDARAICEGNILGAVCVAIASDGGACDTVTGCAWPLRCLHPSDAGACGPGTLAGTACDPVEFTCAPGLSCVDGGCVAPSCPASP